MTKDVNPGIDRCEMSEIVPRASDYMNSKAFILYTIKSYQVHRFGKVDALYSSHVFFSARAKHGTACLQNVIPLSNKCLVHYVWAVLRCRLVGTGEMKTMFFIKRTNLL